MISTSSNIFKVINTQLWSYNNIIAIAGIIISIVVPTIIYKRTVKRMKIDTLYSKRQEILRICCIICKNLIGTVNSILDFEFLLNKSSYFYYLAYYKEFAHTCKLNYKCSDKENELRYNYLTTLEKLKENKDIINSLYFNKKEATIIINILSLFIQIISEMVSLVIKEDSFNEIDENKMAEDIITSNKNTDIKIKNYAVDNFVSRYQKQKEEFKKEVEKDEADINTKIIKLSEYCKDFEKLNIKY